MLVPAILYKEQIKKEFQVSFGYKERILKRGERLMSLVYKNDTYSYNGEYEMGSLNKFAQAERRLLAKKQALDDIKNAYDIIEQQAFRIYKENIQYMLLDHPSTLKMCREW